MSDHSSEIDVNDLKKELKLSSNIKCVVSKNDWDKFLKAINSSNQQVVAAVTDDYGVEKYDKAQQYNRTEQEQIKVHLYVENYNVIKKRNCLHTVCNTIFTPPCQFKRLSAFCDRLKFKHDDHMRCEHDVKMGVDHDKQNKDKKCKRQVEDSSCTCKEISSPIQKIKNCYLKFKKSDKTCAEDTAEMKSPRTSILKGQVKFHEDGITGYKYSIPKYKLAEHKHPSKLSMSEIKRHKRESHPLLRPRGPLVVHKVSPTSVKLIWGNPSQDGLLKIEGYIVEKNDIEKRKWEIVDTVPATRELMEAIVDGLVPAKKYLFSVAASTALGVTEPLVTENPIIVGELENDALKMEERTSRRDSGIRTSRREPAGTPTTSSTTDLSSDPSKQNTLIALQNSPTSALLKWDKSTKPVKKYVVAKKSIGKKDWDIVGNVRGSIENPEFVVSDLKPGRSYSFRVDTQGVLPPLVTEKPFTLTEIDTKFLCPCNKGRDYCKCDGREHPDSLCACETSDEAIMSFRRHTAGKHDDFKESNKKKLRDYKGSWLLKIKSTSDSQKSDDSKTLEEPSDKSPDSKSTKVVKITISPTKRPSPTSSETMSISKRSPSRISNAKRPSTHAATTTAPEEFNEKRPAKPSEKSDPELREDEKLKEKLSVRLNESSKEKLLDKEQLQESPFDGLYTAAREPYNQDDAESNSCACQASDEGAEAEEPEKMAQSGENVKEVRNLSKKQENELRRQCKEKIKELIKKGDIVVKIINGKKHYYTKDGTLLLKKNCRLDIPRRPVPPFLVSTTAQATITLTWDRPNQPRGPLLVTNVTPRSVNLSWNEAVQTDLIPIKNYLVETLEITENGKWMPAEELADVSESNDVIVSDLKPSTGYMFRVLAVNNSGSSEPLYTDDLVYTTSGLPDPPEGPLNVSLTKKEILLSWKKPKSTDEKPVNKYIIDVQDPEKRTWHQVGEVHGSVDQPVIRLTQLHPNKELYFRVFAQNIAGLSDPLNSSAETVKDKKKKKDSLKVPCNCKAAKDDLIPIGPLKVLNKTATSLTISWKEPVPPFNNKVKKYLVEKLDLETGVWKLVDSKQSNENLELLIENLNPKSSYIFRVIASDGVRSSAPLITKRPMVLLKGDETLNPNVVVVSDITANQLKLSWNKFEQNENIEPFKHYTIEKMDISEGKWSSVGCSSPEEDFPEFTVTNLHPGCNYLFRVSTENCNLFIISEKVVQTDAGKHPPRASVLTPQSDEGPTPESDEDKKARRKSEKKSRRKSETERRESATQTQVDSGTQTHKEPVKKGSRESLTSDSEIHPHRGSGSRRESVKEPKDKKKKEKQTKHEKEKKSKSKKKGDLEEPDVHPPRGSVRMSRRESVKESKAKKKKEKKYKPEKEKKSKAEKEKKTKSEKKKKSTEPSGEPVIGVWPPAKEKELNVRRVSEGDLEEPDVHPPRGSVRMSRRESVKESKAKKKKEKKTKPEQKKVSIGDAQPVIGVWPPAKQKDLNVVRVSESDSSDPDIHPHKSGMSHRERGTYPQPILTNRLPHLEPGKGKKTTVVTRYKPKTTVEERKSKPEKERKSKPEKEKKAKYEKRRGSSIGPAQPVFGVWPPTKEKDLNVVRESDEEPEHGISLYKRNTKSAYKIRKHKPGRTYTSYPLFVSHSPGLVNHEKNNKEGKILSMVHNMKPKPKKSIGRSPNVLTIEQIEKNHKNYRKPSSHISGLAKMHTSSGNNGRLKHRYSFKHYEFVGQKNNELRMIAENIDIKECAKLALMTDSEISSCDDDELMPEPNFHPVNQQQLPNSEKSVIGSSVIILLPPNKKDSNRRQSMIIKGRMLKSTADGQKVIELNPSAENRLTQNGHQTQIYPMLMDIPSMMHQQTETKSCLNGFITKEPKTIASDILDSASLCKHGTQNCIICDLTKQIKMIIENANDKNNQDENLENITTGSVDINEQRENITYKINNNTQMSEDLKETIVQEMKVVWEECFKRSKDSIIKTVIDELEQKR